MAEKLATMNLGGTIVPNVTLMGTAGLQTNMDRRPENITAIRADTIEIGERLRPLDPKRVKEIAESIREVGLLHPIGVKRSAKPGGPHRLIYGYHRVEAVRLLAKDDPTQVMIGAAIYPAKMPDWACKMDEITENLFRKNLTPKENEAHTALYGGYLKKHGMVKEAKPGPKPKGDDRNGYAELPTVTEKLVADLGINDKSVQNRIRNAANSAERLGVVIDGPKTPEALTGDELIAIGEAAQMAAELDKEEAAKKGKSPRRINPHEPAGPTTVTVRLDTIDVKPFIDFCRKRLNGEHKPMSLDMLRAYRKALDELIAEYEAKTE